MALYEVENRLKGWERGILALARLTRHRQSQTQIGSVLVRTETVPYCQPNISVIKTILHIDSTRHGGFNWTGQYTTIHKGSTRKEGGRRQAVGRQDVHVDAHVDAHVEGA